MAYNLEYKIEERDEEETEETLSLCDLPLCTSDSADFSGEEQSFLSLSSSFSTDDTLFEFSSSDLSDYPIEEILFCGKKISPREEIIGGKSQKSNSGNWLKRAEGDSIFPKIEISKIDLKKSNSVNLVKRVPGKLNFSQKEISKAEGKKSQLKPNSADLAKKVHRRGAGSANQQWPLLMFGSARVPESRRSSAVKGDGSERKMRREKKLWGVIRALGCGGGYLTVA